ncbi:hypothetical protein ACWGH8_42855 [Nonomuraea muscovyensis]|uniref:hypothetical protein n=1 Tax=Nonomuraea muscovyensis TaxID=1124761 RepID=UPI0033F3642A
MRNRLSAFVLSATLATTAVAATPPTAHATTTAPPAVATRPATAAATLATRATTAGATSAGRIAVTTTARPKLIRTKIYFGRCKDTCRIKVRIRNVSRERLHDVTLNARLEINNRKAGSCYDYVGGIRPRATRWAGCTVRSSTLAKLWNRWLDGEIRWDREARTVVAYEYYA